MSENTEQTVAVTMVENFTKDSSLRINFLLLATLLLISATVGYVLLVRKVVSPNPSYFAMDQEFKLIKEVAINKPNMATNVLLNWLTDAILRAHTFNYLNFPAKMQAVSAYFHPDGYEEYKAALASTNIMQKVISDKMVLTAIPLQAPKILKEDEYLGRYLWKVEYPKVEFRMNSVANVAPGDNYNITLVVMRVPITESQYGVKILKYALTKQGFLTGSNP